MTRKKPASLSSDKSPQMHEVYGEILFYAYPSYDTVVEGKYKTMHILSADDQPTVRSAIRLLLEHQPDAYVVEEAANAQELLNHVGNCCPDVLLLDWELPGLTPEKLLATLHTFYPHLFTIVLDSKPQTRQIALLAGANEFVSKNEPPEKLLAAIKSHKVSNKKKN